MGITEGLEKVTGTREEPVEKGEVLREMDKLATSTSGLLKQIVELEADLTPVLREEGEKDQGGGKEAPVLVPLAHKISINRIAIDVLMDRVVRLRDRLEL